MSKPKTKKYIIINLDEINILPIIIYIFFWCMLNYDRTGVIFYLNSLLRPMRLYKRNI